MCIRDSGNPACEIWGDRYKSFLMISGGIGITPLQSTANQIQEQWSRGRPVNLVRFVWSVRDRATVNAMYDPAQATGIPTRLPLAFQPDLVERRNEPLMTRPSPLVPEFHLTQATPETLHATTEEGAFADADTLQVDACQMAEIKPHLRHGRPDLHKIFTETKEAAVAAGDLRVAVMVCGPLGMVGDVVRLCQEMSDDRVTFDPSEEVFEF
eukprot:TRINITY_DN37060_c0_g1_i1.p1 TRINITY_DN37060_c0_g1~~TRINITY_DN37060_c0_g1_i1.p1  ORF type:complete len:211 (+),score=28.66 TRINITY_DN37060_c0_g1_i1:137-769(+)